VKTIVIAGNYNQGLNWAESDCKKRWANGNTSISLSEYIIVSNANQLRGIQDPHGVFVGTWREREDIEEIVETLFMQSIHVNRELERIRSDIRKHGKWNIYDTNPLPLNGRCVGMFKLPENFSWKSVYLGVVDRLQEKSC